MRIHRPLLTTLALGLACAIASGTPAGGASSSVVITLDVGSATSIVPSGCATGTPDVTSIGVVQAGADAVTRTDCIVEFGSSNNTSMLLVQQRDGFGRAMYGGSSGALDTDTGDGDHFSTDGKAYVNPPGNGEANGAGMQRIGTRAGKTILVGYSNSGAMTLIARMNPDGTPDNSFGNSGAGNNWTIIDIDPVRGEEAEAIFVMDDDRLVVTGATFDGVGDPDWAILRLTADGMPDVSFGTNGVVQLDLGGYDSPPAPIVDDQDRVVVGGMSESDVVLGRLTAGGQWDDSFGMANGRTRLTFPDDFDYGATLLQQSTGRWVVAGTQDGTDADIALAGFNADGTVDTTFGSGGTGRRITDIGGSGDHDEIEDAMLLPDDSIVVAGEHDPAGPSQMLVAKYSSNGTLANGSFGGATGTGPGYATFLRDPGGSKAEGVLAQPDGRLVLGITDDSTGTGDFGAIRVLANGVADSTFTGDVGLGSGSSDMDTMIWSFDGKPLLIGDSGSDLAIFRLDVPRILDYLSPSSTWSAGANSFGACLRAVSNGATTDVSTWTPTGSCTASDADPWHGIPTQASASEAKIAAAPSGDLDARAHLRFGIRTANSQAPTGYWAPMTFVVLAPDA